MNLLAANGFETFINGIFANWQMILFVIAAVILLLTILFRKFKITFIILLVAGLAIVGVLLVDLVVEAVKWDTEKLVDFLVKWLPTVLFAVWVLLATLFGAIWGLRKSLIFLAHAVATGAICIILYVVLVTLPQVDGFLLKVVDFFMGGSGSLQRTLGVTAECEGLKDVMVEWLPKVVGDNTIGTMLGDSKAYIYTLADMIMHAAFALVLFVVYVILNIILYIVYHCCYPERKYKKQIAERYVQNKVDRRYSKHSLGGSVVGLVRGITAGLIGLSFLGSALFVVAGRGDGTMTDFDFGDKNINQYYSIYRSIESYGTYGIFKVLNSVSSTEEVPYYLFAADLIFSGELDDEEFGVKDHVVFREELSAYTDFARDTMNLLIKYGGDEIKPLINGTATKSAFDTVMGVMENDLFRMEFNDLISEFDTKTYVINFAMSFVNSAIANIDEMSFASAVSGDNRELLKILFTKGHYSDIIPDEKEKKENLTQGDEYDLPYINVSKVVDKEDVKIIFNIVLDLLSDMPKDLNSTLSAVGKLLPEVQKISLLNENRAKELDPVLGRLYCYAANRYLTTEGSTPVRYSTIYNEQIEWISEINALINVADSALGLYDNVYAAGKKPLDMVVTLFDKGDKNYEANSKYYDRVCDSLARSKILGNALRTSFVYRLMETALGSVFSGIYIPDDMQFENVYDGSTLIKGGEMYNVFNGVRALGRNSNLLQQIGGFSDGTVDANEFIDNLAGVLTVRDENNFTIANYIVRSDLLRSVISAALINNCSKFVYVPTVAREEDSEGNSVKFIKQAEIITLFDCFTQLADFLKPIVSGSGSVESAITEFLNDGVFNTLLDNCTIFEGTVGKLLAESLNGSTLITIPNALCTDYDGWATQNNRDGELKKLLKAADTVGLDVGGVLNGEVDKDSILDSILTLSQEGLTSVLNSEVIHHTISSYLIGDGIDFNSFKLIVPQAAQTETDDGGVTAHLVKKSEIGNIIKLVGDLNLNDESDVSSVFVKVVQNKQMLADSYILSASLAYALVNNEETADLLNISDKYKEAATLAKLSKFNSSNPWKVEITRLVDALDEALNISESSDFKFDSETLNNSLSSFMKGLNEPSNFYEGVSRLVVCLASEVFSNNVTVHLDNLLEGKIDSDLLVNAKRGGYYTERELSALSGALQIFDIDLMNVDSDSLLENVKSDILTLNDPDPDHGYVTKLSVIYSSAIISGLISNELDLVLKGGTDDEGNEYEAMIDATVLYKINNGNRRYPEEEVAALIDAVKVLGVESFNDVEDIDLTMLKNSKDNIDVICNSRIMRGVFTTQIAKNDELNADHELAYEIDMHILKSNEIEAVIDLVALVDEGKENVDIENMLFETLELADLRDCIFDEKQGEVNVRSYILLKATSSTLRTTKDIYVDRMLMNKYDCIDETEVYKLINAFIALDGEGVTLQKWGVVSPDANTPTTIKYPNAEARKIAFASRIVRAKVTEQIISSNSANSNQSYYISWGDEGNIRTFKEYFKGTTRREISEKELNAICNGIDGLNEGDGGVVSFVIPKLDTDKLIELRQDSGDGKSNLLIELFNSDVFTFKISEILRGQNSEYKQAYCLTDGSITDRLYIDKDEALNIIDAIIEASKPQPEEPAPEE